MQVTIRAIKPGDYPVVRHLCKCELGNSYITEDNLAETMEKMGDDASYNEKTTG